MRTRVTVLCLSVCLSVCLFVCYQSPGFFSRLYDKLDIPACSSLVFLGFQLTDFDKTVSFGRYSAFHGYFVVSSPYERFRILLVATTVTWSDTPAPHVQYYFCQLSKFDRSLCSVGVWSGQWPPSDWQVKGNTYSWLYMCHRSSCIFKETVSVFFATSTVAIISR